jgi:hypothetical protein
MPAVIKFSNHGGLFVALMPFTKLLNVKNKTFCRAVFYATKKIHAAQFKKKQSPYTDKA